MVGDGVKHIFVSYVREDHEQVDKLCEALDAARIPYWRDRTALAPGDAWKQKIRDAIRSGALVFLACFSEQSIAKTKSYMNEELTLAVEEFRMLPPGATWLIPVRFDEVDAPQWALGAGRVLSDLNYADLFGEKYVANLVSLTNTVSKVMGTPGPNPEAVRASIEGFDVTGHPALPRGMGRDAISGSERRKLWYRERRFVTAVGFFSVLLLAGGVTWVAGGLDGLSGAASAEPSYELNVNSNPDQFQRGYGVPMSYYFEKPVDQIPAPPEEFSEPFPVSVDHVG